MADALDALIRRRRNKASDQQNVDFSRAAARKFSKGRFTASQTGARQLAEKRKYESDMGELGKSLTAGTAESENYIKTGKYKKGGG